MNSPLISFHSRRIHNAGNIYFRFSFLLLILSAETSVFPTACGGPTAYNIAFCIAAIRSGIESPTTAPGPIATDKTSSDNLSFIGYLLPHRGNIRGNCDATAIPHDQFQEV